IAAEYYFGIVIDRESARPVVMASSAGGMEIEQVSADAPELICKQVIDTPHGLFDFQARSLAYEIGLSGAVARQAAEVMVTSQRLFLEIDASLLEINPLIVTKSGDVLILDAKISLDDNALYRHMDLAALRDVSEEDALEVEASKYGLNYIRLDGNIGCMVNGAGLAMATMDIIKLAGGNPANFLDVGGGANDDQIRNAFRIVLADTNVKAVLINIFGGILRCDVLASGLIDAVKELDVDIPVVIRMEGTNVNDGRSMLRGSGLNFTTVLTMDEAASAVVALAADSK
ncbi:MAG TPA: ADP-forming succinate--CoA ligase subunit beta, partial [Acidobacteria bacterium]|nr:ADP-forming succinate--CoA ligase subunit beta [Acidobacteriota bacterium]